MPLLLSHLNFLPDFIMNLLPNSPISQNVLFVKPTIVDMPLLSSGLNFCEICHFYKIVICQDALFVVSAVFRQTLELSIFAEISRFLIIAICQDSPLWHLK